MTEISWEETIEHGTVVAFNSDELEKMISQKIASGLASEMEKHIENMSFIDMKINEDTGNFDIKAELVLCSKSDIITNSEIQAQKLAGYGLTENQILDVLETQLEENGGF